MKFVDPLIDELSQVAGNRPLVLGIRPARVVQRPRELESEERVASARAA